MYFNYRKQLYCMKKMVFTRCHNASKLVFLALIFSLCSCDSGNNGGTTPPPPTPKTTPIDIVLIAGQSNAAGYSPIQSNQTETFENVIYAGETDHTLIGKDETIGSDFLSSKDKYVNGVRGGLGHSPNHIGPEYGIAQYFNDQYDESYPLMIFKTAAGGTTLADVSSNLSGVYGNWISKSKWPSGYEPNIEQASPNNKATGLLYKLFLENFRSVYQNLIDNDYDPNILGMVWMQGESDADLGGSYIANYGATLRTFITDIREDLSDITNIDLSDMPFVIGKIATSYVSYNREQNIQLIAQQTNIANYMGETVDVVETSDLIIKKPDGSRNEGVEDDWHFNFKDMTTLGNRFAKKLEELL